MKISSLLKITTLGLCVVACGCSDAKKERQYQAEIESLSNALRTATASFKAEKELTKSTESKLVQVTQVLTNSTARLREIQQHAAQLEGQLAGANQRLAAIQAQAKQVDATGRQIHTPVEVEAVDGYGTPQKFLSFPVLIGRMGEELGKDAHYRGLFRSRVVFWFGGTKPTSFDVADLHPKVLEQLGIDPGKAKQAEATYQAQGRAQRLAALAEAERMRKEMELRRIEEEKLAVEYAKQAEAARKDWVKEQMAWEMVQNDRIKAEAAARSADAAIIDALNPLPETVIQNVNRNTIYR